MMLLPPPPLDRSANREAPLRSGGVHLSTAIVLVLVVAALVLANLPGQVVLVADVRSQGKYGPHFGMGENCRHGWPCTFLVREPVVVQTPSAWDLRLSLWGLSEGVVSLNWTKLAANLGIAPLLVLLAGVAFERWRRRRRHLFQLHLIDLMLAVVAVACGLSYYVTNAKHRNSQEKIVKQIQQHETTEKGETFDSSMWERGGPTWLRRLIGDRPFAAFDRVVELDVEDGRELSAVSSLDSLKVLRVLGDVSNEQLDSLRGLPELEALDICFVNVAGEGDEQSGRDDAYLRLPRLPQLRGLNMYETGFRGDGLEGLTGIEVLDLSGTEITDGVMPKLAGLRHLRDLSLAGTKVTDAGLVHLKGLMQLQRLALDDIELTDSGLEHLKSLTRLQELYFDGTRVTDEGLTRLQRALPNCDIRR